VHLAVEKEPPLEIESHVYERNHYRHFDQGADYRRKRSPRVDSEYGDRDGDSKFEVV
jgi:hypothetical protein